MHYHITEFFRINEGAKLYVQSVASADGNYTEVKTLQAFAQGKPRQIAVCDFKTELSGLDNALSKLNTIGKELAKRITPVSLLYSFKLKAEDIANLPDLHTKSAELVSVVIGQDGAGRGAYIAQTTPAVGCIGAALGAISKASVHESIRIRTPYQRKRIRMGRYHLHYRGRTCYRYCCHKVRRGAGERERIWCRSPPCESWVW
ncbi:hypothetical protein [Capnocytophaga leadbetteri]|uniref:hypothetical protein n=1 Tax=Capnocytophaga leadbetteri TaxID=327575 RepID=UPI0028EDAB7E|nr:hypothetical protein [Capnocytophaga leadbetteri]